MIDSLIRGCARHCFGLRWAPGLHSVVWGVVLASAAPRAAAFLDTRDLDAVVASYESVYVSTEDAQPGWTGDTEDGVAGETDTSFKQAVLDRINWFRTMAGVPPVDRFIPALNDKAQQAALMMSANAAVNHNPPDSWLHYTDEGAQAARNSNLVIGYFGTAAITRYIADEGSANYDVGHRRWLLRPRTTTMGTGDIPQTRGYLAANAVWVVDPNSLPERPDTRHAFVAWPPPGYVPYEVVFPRWSFTYPGADLSSASITFTRDGRSLAVDQRVVSGGSGGDTLVWVPVDPLLEGRSGPFPRPATAVVNHVRIEGLKVGGESLVSTYSVIILDPVRGPAEDPPSARSVYSGNVRSSPATVPDGAVYVAARSRLVALDPGEDDILWERFTGSSQSSPTVGKDGVIYVGMEGSDPGLIAFNSSGVEQWRVSTTGAVVSSPAIAVDGTIVFGTTHSFVEGKLISEGVLRAIEPSGDTRWAYTVGADLESSPAVGANGLAYVGSSLRQTGGLPEVDGRLFAVDVATGDLAWQFLADGSVHCSAALGADGTVYFGTANGRVYALDADSGAIKWEFLVRGSVHSSSPILARNDMLYVGTTEGHLCALNARDGTKSWSYNGGDTFEACAVAGQNGYVYAGVRNGMVFALEAATGARVWTYDTERTMSTASPVIAHDGTLYVGTEGRWFDDGEGGKVYLNGHLHALDIGDAADNRGLWPVFGQNPGHTSRRAGGSRINSVIRSEDGLAVILTAAADTGVVYAAQSSVDLDSWTTWTNLAAPSGQLEAIHTDSTGPGCRFYRFQGLAPDSPPD